MDARTLWRSRLMLVGGVLAVLVGIVVVMESRADAPESPVAAGTTDADVVSSVPGQPTPSETASPAQQELLDATPAPTDLGEFGLSEQGRIADDEWSATDAYLCPEVLEARTLATLPVVHDHYGAPRRWLSVSYFDLDDPLSLEERTAEYRDPTRRCDWEDEFNAAIEPFDVAMRGASELYGFTSGDSGHWVVTDGQGRAGLVWSNAIDTDLIEPIALALLADGPLATPNR